MAPVPVTNGLLEGLLFSPLPKCLSFLMLFASDNHQSQWHQGNVRPQDVAHLFLIRQNKDLYCARNIKVRDWYVLYGEFGETDQIVMRYL